jgi:RHS repeat-associated protein
VIALTDTFKNVQRTYEYGPWGTLTGGGDFGSLGGKDRARFKGALWLGPEAEVYYMRARWYEPKTGRFLSEDPIGLAGGINLYSFAGDDPVNGSDPLGLDHDEDDGPCPEGFELVAVVEINYGDGTGVILHKCVNAAGEVKVVSVPVLGPITVSAPAGDGGPVRFNGFVGTAIARRGYTVAGGLYCVAAGCGLYFREGGGLGVAASATMEVGVAENLPTFKGVGVAACGSVLAVGACGGGNRNGWIVSANAGPSLTRWGLHGEGTWTFTTAPSPFVRGIIGAGCQAFALHYPICAMR